MDLFKHKVLVTGFLGSFKVPFYFLYLLFSDFSISVKDLYTGRSHNCSFKIIYENDIPCIIQKSGYIRCGKILPIPKSYNKWTVFLSKHEFSLFVCTENGKGIRNLQFLSVHS